MTIHYGNEDQGTRQIGTATTAEEVFIIINNYIKSNKLLPRLTYRYRIYGENPQVVDYGSWHNFFYVYGGIFT